MKINRVWAMPNKHTFLIEPIAKLLRVYNVGVGWVDPFAGENSPAELTNDINPMKPAKFHMDAHEFVSSLNGQLFCGVLFDPPYSLEQTKRSYDDVGRKFTMRDGQISGRWTEIKNGLADRLLLGGVVISFGWNTVGFGKSRGFKLEEVMLICHGGAHNDTLITVERKTQAHLEFSPHPSKATNMVDEPRPEL